VEEEGEISLFYNVMKRKVEEEGGDFSFIWVIKNYEDVEESHLL
jgi:hypothetical protein